MSCAKAVVPVDRLGISGSWDKDLSNSQPGLSDCKVLAPAAPQVITGP